MTVWLGFGAGEGIRILDSLKVCLMESQKVKKVHCKYIEISKFAIFKIFKVIMNNDFVNYRY